MWSMLAKLAKAPHGFICLLRLSCLSVGYMYHYGSICVSTKENRKILGLYVEVCRYGLVDIKSL